MKKNYLHFITGAIGSLKGLGRSFRLRLKQLTILSWCLIVIAFLCPCVTGPMKQGPIAPIYNLLREPYAGCNQTLGVYMQWHVNQGYRLWSGPEGEKFQTRFLLPKRTDFTVPRQYIVLSLIENPPAPAPNLFVATAAGVCDTDEYTVYYYIFHEIIQELEASN